MPKDEKIPPVLEQFYIAAEGRDSLETKLKLGLMWFYQNVLISKVGRHLNQLCRSAALGDLDGVKAVLESDRSSYIIANSSIMDIALRNAANGGHKEVRDYIGAKMSLHEMRLPPLAKDLGADLNL